MCSMKKELQLVLALILVLSLVSCVSAYSTNIHVKTPINKQVQLSIVTGGGVVES